MDSQPLPVSSKQNSDIQGSSLTIQSFPRELSRAICQLSLSDNRVMTIHWVRGRLGDLPVANEFHATYDKIEALEVSSESRTLALENYKLCFSNDMRHPVYFNSNKDILKFTNFTLKWIAFSSLRDVWKIESLRDANVKRIAVDLRSDVDLLPCRFEQAMLCHATVQFATLETVFVQPSCVIDSSSEATFRARFKEQMEDYQLCYDPRKGKSYNIPEIVFICFQCDPNLSKACQR
ncbi:hypothetical protein BOTCAL_0277g00190 [Botryotinia calthae]|uniref:2EXR domain-containing protein n=1 Tax=Botryotinia calthae TaxID=38488 RepID=A0A4Y8CVE4_9HELO|nr:hypothetical protein BOTCAL_0277g00190 [Botryotinia calthae]